MKRRVRAELAEAVERTEKAQQLAAIVGMTIEKEQVILDYYQNGEKLAKIIEFTKEKAIKHFGQHVALPSLPAPEAAAELLDRFDAEHVSCDADSDELALLEGLPATWSTSVSILTFCGRCCPATAWRSSSCCARAPSRLRCGRRACWRSRRRWRISTRTRRRAASSATAPTTDVLAAAKQHALLFAVGFLFSRPIEMLASSFGDKAARDFSGPLREAVLCAIMRQDTESEYFDFNSAAVLQERLNRDTNMLWIPQQTLEFTFRVIQRVVTLYLVAPAMLRACLWFNVPLFTCVILATSRPLRCLWGQRDRSRDRATKDTLEMLQKVRTVRQFSMERAEGTKYALSNLGRNVFESRIRVLESVTHNLRFVIHMLGELYVIYTALVLCVEGEVRVADAIVGSTVGMWLQHDFKNLLEQVPKLLKVMKRCTACLRCWPAALASSKLVDWSSATWPSAAPRSAPSRC